MKNIYCVTGASGHLGNNIVRMLAEKGEKVRAFVLNGERTDMLPKNVEILFGDTRNKDSLLPLFEKQIGEELVVIHTAAVISITEKYDKRVFDVNVTGTENVVDLCVSNNVKKLVHVGSVHAIAPKNTVYEESTIEFDENKVKGNYAKSKAAAVKYVLEKTKGGLDACVLLPSGILGINDYGNNHLNAMIKRYISGKLPVAVKGEYDFVDVFDVAEAVISAAEKGRRGECYLITNENASIKTLLDYASDALGLKRIKLFAPLWAAKFAAPFCERYYKHKRQTPLFTKYSLQVLNSKDKFSHAKAREELNYRPKPLRDTVAQVCRWFIENGVTVGKRMIKNPVRKKCRSRT